MRDILNAIKACGPLKPADVKTIVENLYLFQTGVYEMEEDDFRDAVNEAMEED